MKQYGYVIKRLDEEKVLVKARKHTACKNCGGCGGANKRNASNQAVVEARDNLGVSPGASVIMEADSKTVLLGAFLVYLLPVLALIIGLVVGIELAVAVGVPGNPDLWGLASGLVLMTAYFLLLHWRDNKIKKSGKVEIIITGIMDNSQDINHEFTSGARS